MFGAESGPVSIAVAVISAVIAVLSITLQFRSDARRRREDRHLDDAKIARRYLEPMHLAVRQLQARLANIEKKDFLRRYGSSRADYPIQSTMFVLAETLASIELWRQERQFDDVSPATDKTRLERHLAEFGDQLATDEIKGANGSPAALMVWRHEQRAIGEIMIDRSTGQPRCLGYAAFSDRLKTDEFARWFQVIRTELTSAITDSSAINPRLRSLQSACDGLAGALAEMLADLESEMRLK